MLSCSALAVPSGLIGQGWHAPVRTVDSTAMGPLARLLLGHCAQLVGAWVPSSNWPTDQSQGTKPVRLRVRPATEGTQPHHRSETARCSSQATPGAAPWARSVSGVAGTPPAAPR